MRFVQERSYRHKSAQFNFGAHPKIDVIWGHGTPHQQFAFLLITKFRAIWIKHHSASDGVLFRRIANNKTIASKCKGWRCESYLSDLFLRGSRLRFSRKVIFAATRDVP